MVVGFISASPSESTGNSSGKPPACRTPRFTATASSRRCELQLTSSLQLLQMPISGLLWIVSSEKPSDFIQLRCRNPSRPSPSNQLLLRYSVSFELTSSSLNLG